MTREWLRRGVVIGIAAALAGPARADDPRPKVGAAPGQPAVVPDPAFAERLAQVRREFDGQREACQKAREAAKTEAEGWAAYFRLAPDDAAFSRRMIDLALAKPSDPASRDALIWVIDKPYRGDAGPYGDEFARAAALIVRHHADDPVAVAVAFGLDNVPTSRRDAFLFGLVAAAKSRETRGMARLALARYLEKKTLIAAGARKHRERVTYTQKDVLGGDGKPHDRQIAEPDDDYAYRLATSFCDPDALRAEVARLDKEVIAEYGDVPYRTTRHREVEALLRDPNPMYDGRPLTPEERQQAEAIVHDRTTLKDVAEGYLDELANVAEDKPAPPIEGTDAEGKPRKLADYRGKVVALIFWGSWCGPCMAAVPHEREVAAKYRDRPVALLGVDCNETGEAARKAIAENGITWPNWIDGNDGPIATKYHIESFPTIVVIGPDGTLVAKNAPGEALDRIIDQLLARATEAKASAPVGAK